MPESPGAADDGLGVAVSLEAARVLAAAADRTWSTFVIVTDGEEAGLMGAAALVTDREVMNRLQAYINVEAAGSNGPAMLFESGPGNAWVTGPWARAAPHPRGASYGFEVYRRLPNDTDFTMLARHGIPGLNFALIGDGYSYHTARDVPDRITPRTLREVGENVVATARALDGRDVTQRRDSAAVYFDVGGVTAVSYGARLGWALSIAAVVLGALACARILPAAVRVGGVLRWILTMVWSVAGFAAAAAAMAGSTRALRSARAVYHPWYAHPDRLFLLLLAVGVTVAWRISRTGHWLPARAHRLRDPLVTWSVALPFWLLASLAMLWVAPAAAYLWTLPMLAAAILLLIVPPGSEVTLRIASVAILAVAATLWLRDTVELLRFMTPLFGRLPIITPYWVYAVVVAAAALMLAPPFIAAIANARPLARPSLVTTGCLLVVAGAGAAAWAAPAYTHDQPQRRVVRALQEAGGASATWELGSNEPGLDLAAGAPGGWALRSDAAPAAVPWGRLPHPFVFRAAGPALGAAPATVTSLVSAPVAAGSELTVTVVPNRRGIAVSFVLPAGTVPARSSLPGALRLGRWTATYIAPPAEGIAWRATFAVAAARPEAVEVVAADAGVFAADGMAGLPAWLPQDRSVWSATATWVLPPPQRPLPAVDPVPALR